MQQGIKPFPPFGAILNQMNLSNVKPRNSIFVYCGDDSWHYAKTSNNNLTFALCLPPDKNPNEYKWPVKGQSLIICDTGNTSQPNLRLLALCLLEAEARQVCIFTEQNTVIDIYNV